VIGSGIAAQRLSPGNTGLQLFENAAATAAGLFAVILMFGPISGGHFNPVVSFVDAVFGGISRRDSLAYLVAQVTGCILGAITANVMFALQVVSISTHHRASPAHVFSEVIATFGLLLLIFALARSHRLASAPAAVGAYIGAACFFTSSTSFANPAISPPPRRCVNISTAQRLGDVTMRRPRQKRRSDRMPRPANRWPGLSSA
jgi:arsenate reductase